MEKNRISRLEWIDYAKAIAIILVVYRHILIGIQRAGIPVEQWLINANEMVFSFRMPLFFIISGIFISRSITKRSNSTFVGYKFDTILYPYFVWGFIQISIQIFFSRFTNAERGLIDYFHLFIQPRSIDQMWYLFALFNVSILFYFFYAVLKCKEWIILTFALLFYGASVWVQEYSLIHDLLYYNLFFVVGHLISSFMLNQKNYRFFYTYKPFLILTPFFWTTQWYWLNHRDMNMYLFAIIALLGSFYIFSISFIFAKKNYIPFLKIAGKHSLQIYLLHVMIVAAVRIVLTHLFGITQAEVILLLGWALGVCIPILIYRFIAHTKLVILFRGKIFG
jgi:fucose 4-O-acetylase-like acetyltransferase